MLSSYRRALKLFISHSKLRQPAAKMSSSASLADSPLFQAIFTDEVKALQSIFQKHGYDLRLAGGAVRDILAQKTPKDLDFATPATPEVGQWIS